MLRFSTPEIDAFWETACSAMGISPDSPHCASTFAEPRSPDRVADIDALAQLANENQKRGTAHLAVQFENDGIPMRNIGDYWIVVKCDGTPICVVQIIGIHITPCDQVDPVFAASEGEGDLSLAYWRDAHIPYFQSQCERWGMAWREDLAVVCESFIVVYRPDERA